MKKKSKFEKKFDKIEKSGKKAKLSFEIEWNPATGDIKPISKHIELAAQDKTEELQKYVDKILKALGHSDALATDESYVSDFLPFLGSMDRKKEFEKFRKKMKKMGVDVEFHESIVEVAEKLKAKDE